LQPIRTYIFSRSMISTELQHVQAHLNEILTNWQQWNSSYVAMETYLNEAFDRFEGMYYILLISNGFDEIWDQKIVASNIFSFSAHVHCSMGIHFLFVLYQSDSIHSEN